MKARGKLIIDEFELLRNVAGNSGLQLPPEITQGKQHLRKRDRLFKKLKLDPDNEHHVAFLCSIVYDQLYLDRASPTDEKFGGDKDFDLLMRIVNFQKKERFKVRSKLYRAFIESNMFPTSEYRDGVSENAFRMRVQRAARKAVTGELELTSKRKVRLQKISVDATEVLRWLAKAEQAGPAACQQQAQVD